MKSKNSGWKVVLIVIAIIIAVGLMAVLGVQSYMNRAISMEEQVTTAKSDVNVQEKRRVDLLGNLVDCVKNYDKHEYDTLKAIVDGRSSDDDKAAEIKTSIKAVSEAYPELKSNENYKQLMNELAAEGDAIIMISSDMEEVLGMSDRIVVFHEGTVSGEINKNEFSQNNVMMLASGVKEEA